VRKTGIVIALLFTAVVLLLVSLQLARTPEVSAVVLPDGTVLRVEKVSFGTEHELDLDRRPFEKIRKWLQRIFPRLAAPAGSTLKQTTELPALVMWISRSVPGSNTLVMPDYEMPHLVDSHGCTLGRAGTMYMGTTPGPVGMISLTGFPRNEKELQLILTTRFPTSNVVSRFRFRNPGFAERAIPMNPLVEELPITRSNQHFVLKIHEIGKRPGSQPASLLVRDEIFVNGQPSLAWRRQKALVKDRWGNVGEYSTLCFQEPWWLLKATYHRTPHADSDEIISIPIKEPPPPGEAKPLNVKKQFGPAELSLIALAGNGMLSISNNTLAGSERASGSGFSFSSSESGGVVRGAEPMLALAVQNLAPEQKIIAWTEDEEGKKHEMSERGRMGNTHIYTFPPVTNLTALHVSVSSAVEIEVATRPNADPTTSNKQP
jgi:hypothetical protein